MNRLSTDERSRVIACLVEGNSQRATVRMTNVARQTVADLAVQLGEACERFADNIMRDLPCTQIQCDEIWSFCYAKAKNVPQHLKGSGAGDVWTWVAIDPDTKLIPAWYIGDRTAESAYPFMRSVAKRMKNRVKLSTDGHRAYLIMRRFTRLTNAFSKKIENHRLACALHFVHYNFCRIHSSLRITPAMAAGLSERVWELSDLVGLLESEEIALAA